MVITHLFIFYGDVLAVLGLGAHVDTSCALAVAYEQRGVGRERQLALIAASVLGQFFLLLLCVAVLAVGRLLLERLALSLLFLFLALYLRAALLASELVVDLLQEGDVVVQPLHVEGTVDIEVTVAHDVVAQRGAVVERRAAHPVVGGVVGGVDIGPVEYRDEVEWHLVRQGEVLAVVERRSHVAQTRSDRVFPLGVLVGIAFLVDGSVGLFDFSVRGTLEVHVQIACKVPSQGEITVPEELRAEGQRQLSASEVFHVALLQLVVAARYLGVEAHVLREPVESELLDDIEPFRPVLD